MSNLLFPIEQFFCTVDILPCFLNTFTIRKFSIGFYFLGRGGGGGGGGGGGYFGSGDFFLVSLQV